MLSFLAAQPLFTLILILAVGFGLGRVRFGGFMLGPAAILFVAIALATAEPGIALPPLIYQLGLAIFVYTIGLSAGHAFFADFFRRGLKLNIFVLLLFVVLIAGTILCVRMLALDPATSSGTFSGALTSTPGMAAIVELLEGLPGIDPEAPALAVVGYSLAYPGGVLGSIAVAAIGAKMLRTNHIADAKTEGLIHEALEHLAVEIGSGIEGHIHDIPALTGVDVLCTRVMSGPDSSAPHYERLAQPDDPLVPGMRVLLNGTPEDLSTAASILGKAVKHDITQSDIVYRRITVSNPAIAGRSIEHINPLKHGFIIARVRRGDDDLVPHPKDVLQFSDRVRAVAHKDHMPQISKLLGDSERTLADVNLFPFAVGLACGLLLGVIPIPLPFLPGDAHLTLGFGGGPIVAGMVLGALSRTGNIQWQIPYHANRALGGLGLSLFLAAVGTIAGTGFRDALTDPASLTYIAVGFGITVISAILVGLLGLWVLHLKWDEAMGVAAGVTTNPAILSYLNDFTGTELAARGYTTVYPVAMISKIIGCQILLLMLIN